MYPYAAPSVVWFGVPALALLVVVLALQASFIALRRLGRSDALVRTLQRSVVVLTWLALFAGLSLSGVLARFELRPPPLVLVLVATFAAAVSCARSRVGQELAQGLPLAALVVVQGFRFPLELVMHAAAKAGVMPVQMSFSGFNFDIVTGALALVLGPLIAWGKVPRFVVGAWNLLGLGLLANVIVIAVLSSPLVHAFGEHGVMNTWICYFPFVYLPTVLVFCALAGHLIIWRKLRSERALPPSAAAVGVTSRQAP